MINLLFALVACDGMGTGPDDSGSNDDTSVTPSFSAKLEITLPAGESVEETQVSVDGHAVPSCDAASHKCSYDVSEPATYEVTARCESTYFAPLYQEVAEDDNGQTLSSTWTTGGCADQDWQPGDGYCEDEDGKSLWTNGQVACDFSGEWIGIEDAYWDWRSDLDMIAADLDGDGVASEVAVTGAPPFYTGDITNVSGTRFYSVVDDVIILSGELVKESGDGYVSATSCTDFDAALVTQIHADTGDKGEFHIRRVSD